MSRASMSGALFKAVPDGADPQDGLECVDEFGSRAGRSRRQVGADGVPLHASLGRTTGLTPLAGTPL